MKTEFDEGSLKDLFEKRRALGWSVSDVLWFLEHPEISNWVRANVAKVEDLLRLVPSAPAPALAPKVTDPFAVKDWKAEMKKFYREVFGIKVDFSSVAINDDPGGFGWAFFVPKGMTENRAWNKFKERFPARSDYGDDHDSAVPTNERVATESYGKRFRPRGYRSVSGV